MENLALYPKKRASEWVIEAPPPTEDVESEKGSGFSPQEPSLKKRHICQLSAKSRPASFVTSSEGIHRSKSCEDLTALLGKCQLSPSSC